MDGFAELQEQLASTLALNHGGSTEPHVVIALPSFSVGESLLSHYVERIPALEHRYLLAQLMLNRIDGCEMVFVSSEAPSPDVVDYYVSLAPPAARDSVRSRFTTFVVPDRSARSVAAKLLDQPALLDGLRAQLAGRPAVIEPWNVTAAEVEVALRLGAPINGTAPELWPLGFKSAGRRLFREAEVPLPYGREDVRTVDDIIDAVADIRAARPGVAGVVVKHDDSGAGDGNVVLDLRGPHDLRATIEALPAWYLRDLGTGGVVEERISGVRFTSPSAQLDIGPDGSVRVLATHEQELGGDGDQVYMGCRFPADPAYAARLGEYARMVGERLAPLGVVGRLAVDFAAARDERGCWDVYALEMNLRKGGTTHPYCALRNLVPGAYDPEAGRWIAEDGSTRAYASTDNLVDPSWRGLAPSEAIARVARAGLQFDSSTKTGVVLHMLSGLAIDGRLGLTAIGLDPVDAARMYEATAVALAG